MQYQGQSFPICCTGCRDEFNENPEKYIKKASLMAQSRGKAKAAPAQVSRFEDAFSGDVADSPSMKPGGRPARATPAKSGPNEEAGAGKAANPDTVRGEEAGIEVRDIDPRRPRGRPAADRAEPREVREDRGGAGELQADRQGLRRDPRGENRQGEDQGPRAVGIPCRSGFPGLTGPGPIRVGRAFCSAQRSLGSQARCRAHHDALHSVEGERGAIRHPGLATNVRHGCLAIAR